MSNVCVEWTPQKVRLMEESRGSVKGFVAVLATIAGDEDDYYATAVAVENTDHKEALACLRKQLARDILVYALMPSSNPQMLAEEIALPFKSSLISDILNPLLIGETEFYPVSGDEILASVREKAWQLFAEQFPVSIHDEWGECVRA